jgi:hypothetical protein
MNAAGYNYTVDSSSPAGNDVLFRSPSMKAEIFFGATEHRAGNNLGRGDNDDAFPRRVASLSRCMSSRVDDRSSSRRFAYRSEALSSFRRSESSSHTRQGDDSAVISAGVGSPHRNPAGRVEGAVVEEADEEGEEDVELSLASEQAGTSRPSFHFSPRSPRTSDDGRPTSAVTDDDETTVPGGALNFFGVNAPVIVPATTPPEAAASPPPPVDFFGVRAPLTSSSPQHRQIPTTAATVDFFGVQQPFAIQQPSSPSPPTSTTPLFGAELHFGLSSPSGSSYSQPAPAASSSIDATHAPFHFGVPVSHDDVQLAATGSSHHPYPTSTSQGRDYFTGAVASGGSEAQITTPAAATPSFHDYFNKYPPTNPLFET